MLYTTGRLTSEMVIKTALMGMPALASRSGFTAWGVEIARAGRPDPDRPDARPALRLPLGRRAAGRDADPAAVPEEEPRHRRRPAASE
jgi:FdhD protein